MCFLGKTWTIVSIREYGGLYNIISCGKLKTSMNLEATVYPNGGVQIVVIDTGLKYNHISRLNLSYTLFPQEHHETFSHFKGSITDNFKSHICIVFSWYYLLMCEDVFFLLLTIKEQVLHQSNRKSVLFSFKMVLN